MIWQKPALARLGWWLRHRVAGVARDYMQPGSLQPGRIVDLVRRPIRPLRFFRPGSAAAWCELRNKLEVYFAVIGSGPVLAVDPRSPQDVGHLVSRAHARGAFRALWLIEGLGNDLAEIHWESSGTLPAGLFDAPGAGAGKVPDSSLLMLHAGMGLAVGRRVFRPLGGARGAGSCRGLAAQALDLCRSGSRSGYHGAALESLGLVARTFRPRWVRRLGEALAELDAGAADYFWHGVGRALYFLPSGFLPWGHATRRAFRTLRLEVPSGRPRLNATAGLAWAVTLVNQRHPAVVAELVTGEPPDWEADAFANGVASAVVMRRATTPEAPFLEVFCSHPEPSPAWRRQVARPCRQALDAELSRLAATDRLDEVFRYHRPGDGVPLP